MRQLAPILIMALLAGCDQINGVADQKISDAEAIGYACRVSAKTPEACMKENEAQSPTSVLAGWKEADTDIHEGKLDPTLANTVKPAAPTEEAKPEGEGDANAEPKKGEADKKSETDKKSESDKKAESKSEKPEAEKSEKSENKIKLDKIKIDKFKAEKPEPEKK